MNRFLQRSLICAFSATALAGCGGESANDIAQRSAAQLNLSGNWYSERQTAQGPVDGVEFLVSETGSKVVFTYCNRMTETLTRDGSQLFDREGKLYYIYVKDPATLASRPEFNFNTVSRKRSTVGRFDYGSVTLALPSGERFTASTDVCAETMTGRYGDSRGNEIAPTLVTLSLPYRASFIRITVAFRQLANGAYRVVDFAPFVQGGVNDVNVSDFYSPELMTPDDIDAVIIRSGTVRVSNYTSTGLTLSADLVTVDGLPVTLAANVRLLRR